MSQDSSAQKALGQAIRDLRQEQGVSQERLALDIGLDRTYMSSVERGRRNVSLKNILRIASALGISGADLLASAGL